MACNEFSKGLPRQNDRATAKEIVALIRAKSEADLKRQKLCMPCDARIFACNIEIKMFATTLCAHMRWLRLERTDT